MASIDMKDAYWHIPIAKTFRPFLAFSAGMRNYQFKVLPFGLNIAPRVFSKVLQPLHSILTNLGVQIVMYLDDWLIFAPTESQCRWMVDTTLRVGKDMGILFNKEKSHLSPTTSLQWLGMMWNSKDTTLSLSDDNQRRCLKSITRALHAFSLSRRQWESLLGSLAHASSTVPLGRLKMKRLLVEGKAFLSLQDRDSPIPVPPSTKPALQWWAARKRLGHRAQWTTQDPFLTLTTDASDFGWGYQSCQGHQGQGSWPSGPPKHINVKELRTVWLALRQEPDIKEGVITVLSDNTATVQCINNQGSKNSRPLLRTSEVLLEEAHRRNLTLQASHLAGEDNTWADALSRNSTSSINWSLSQDCFAHLCSWAGRPQVDLFASSRNHLLPHFISINERTNAGGPDAFKVDWGRWEFIYLFPPPQTQVMLRVLKKLQHFKGKSLLIAPLWERQPWFPMLMQLEPRYIPLPHNAIPQVTSPQLMTSLRLHGWILSD